MTQTPNIPPVIESNEQDYRDSGVTSKVAIAGHPLHPAIVTMPIGLLVGAAGSDVVFWLVGDPFWARASFWLIVAGFAAGILAAITGMVDFVGIRRVREHSAGWAHMYLNVAALLLTGVNLIRRWGDPLGNVLPFGIVISILVATLLGLSGWYGGELVYRHKVAVIGYGRNGRA